MPPVVEINIPLPSEDWELIEACILFTLSANDAPLDPDNTRLREILVKISECLAHVPTPVNTPETR